MMISLKAKWAEILKITIEKCNLHLSDHKISWKCKAPKNFITVIPKTCTGFFLNVQTILGNIKNCHRVHLTIKLINDKFNSYCLTYFSSSAKLLS